MTHRINRRSLLGSGLGVIGAAGFASRTRADDKEKAKYINPPPALSGQGHLAKDYTVVYHNSDPELYVEGCGLTKLSDGTLIAVVPVVPTVAIRKKHPKRWSARPSNTHIIRSNDRGRTWNIVASLPYQTAIPWVHAGALYLFACPAGTKFRNEDLFVLCSKDAGLTWTEQVKVCDGHFWNCHCGMVQHHDRIYAGFCELYGTQGTSPRSPRVIAGDLTADPLDPKSWRMSNRPDFPGIPPQLGQTKSAGWLEQSVIEVQGQLQVVCRVSPGTSNVNMSAVLNLQDDGESLTLKFLKFNSMPGGHLKFSIIYDDVSKLFWTPANPGTRYRDRRFLMLLYSLDGKNWMQAGCIASARSLDESFMYGHSVIDGDDLVTISRTSSGADDMHNADYSTFHRIQDFRRLALPLASG